MEDRETARMRKYGESKTTQIMMATVPHVTSGLGLRKFRADGFLLTRVYKNNDNVHITQRFVHITNVAMEKQQVGQLNMLSMYLHLVI